MDVFLVVAVLHPTKKQQDEDGTTAIVLVQPTAVIAKDSQQAAMKAMRLVPTEYVDNNRLEVRTLPFAKADR